MAARATCSAPRRAAAPACAAWRSACCCSAAAANSRCTSRTSPPSSRMARMALAASLRPTDRLRNRRMAGPPRGDPAPPPVKPARTPLDSTRPPRHRPPQDRLGTVTMLFDFEKMSAQDRYKLVVSSVVPRPIAWVVTQDAAGTVNAAPYSFFNAFSDDPVVIGFGAGPRPAGALKDTADNIRRTGEFVVNLVPESAVHGMNATAIDFPPGVD